MKKYMIFIVAIILSALSINCVNAKEFVNKNGIYINNEQYNSLKSFLDDKTIENLTESDFEILKNKSWNVTNIQSIYIKQVTNYINNIPCVSEQELLTEEQYNNIEEADISTYGNSGKFVWETTYKKIDIILYTSSGSSYNVMLMDLEWKKMPAVRSFDIMAMLGKNFTFNSGTGYVNINYTIGVSNYESTITSSNTNIYKNTKSGISFVVKLPTDLDLSAFHLSMTAIGTVTAINSKVYGTYQHSQKSITQTQAMSHTYSTSGLGGVLTFSDSTITNSYDNMQGVVATVA